ncbi:MAG TPA: chemotaxis protein CheB [Verrucomicrobiae bacterium]|nr:chemotaxis protein CheB [Verrucomicrobiae bacterium]
MEIVARVSGERSALFRQKTIIAIGASAEGVSALSSLFSDFPSPATAAFFVTLHVSCRGGLPRHAAR